MSPLGVSFAAQLPPGRREPLLWWLSAAPVRDVTDDLSGYRDLCGLGETVGADRAVPDVAGVFHLFADDRAVCYGSFTRSHWCEQGARDGHARVVADVASVPVTQRCDRAAGRWPLPLAGRSERARLRAVLVDRLGPRCATCADLGRFIDHHHLTGQVRGYLCGACNNLVDACRHLDGCRFADYLTDPPAASLNLIYPGWERLLRSPRTAERLERYQRFVRVLDATDGV